MSVRSVVAKFSRDPQTRSTALARLRARRRDEALQIVGAALRAGRCVDCSCADPVVLEFDHRDPSGKKFAPSEAMTGKFTTTALVAELAKCELRCANCHRRKTVRDQGTWRSVFLGSSG